MQIQDVPLDYACEEAWGAMKPEKQGWYCRRCRKSVVDLTAMSEDEAIVFLELMPESCISYVYDRDGNILHAPSVPKRASHRLPVIGAGLVLAACNTMDPPPTGVAATGASSANPTSAGSLQVDNEGFGEPSPAQTDGARYRPEEALGDVADADCAEEPASSNETRRGVVIDGDRELTRTRGVPARRFKSGPACEPPFTVDPETGVKLPKRHCF